MSFLREGMEDGTTDTDAATDPIPTTTATNTDTEEQLISNTLPTDLDTADIPTATDSTAAPPINTPNASYSTTKKYDNYNHYFGTATPTFFYGPDGASATIIQDSMNGDGEVVILRFKNGITEIYYLGSSPSASSSASSASSGSTTAKPKVYTGPNGQTASLVTLDNGKHAIQINTASQTQVYYYEDPQDGPMPPPQPPTPASAETSNIQTGPSWYDTAFQTMSGTTGIPKNLIPPGQEDLYVLKSSIVPPNCPAPIVTCPSCQGKNSGSGGGDANQTCPPCPACARCPEPDFTCKKVPNYNNPDMVPQPISNNYTMFGM